MNDNLTSTQYTGQPIEFPNPKIISVNGIEMEIFEAGTHNEGKPIVLCHGFPEHAYSWRYQLPALVKAGYHVIVPNQRGYGKTSCPLEVTNYDIHHLTGDLVALLDHYGYQDATFVGHDWGANVVWHLALLHPKRVSKIINMALPYQERGERPWLEVMEEVFGDDFYFVHFNKLPGFADSIMEDHTYQFIRNLYRKNLPQVPPEPGMLMINIAKAPQPLGEPIMSDAELSVFINSFDESGFTPCINWYRNLDRNWHLMAGIEPKIEHPTLMIYGKNDAIPQSPTLKAFAPNLNVVTLDAGHWIQQEKPEETNKAILAWLVKNDE